MSTYIELLEAEFLSNNNRVIAEGQAAYMKNKFKFLGIKSPLRKELQKPFLLLSGLPEKEEIHKIVKTLWQKPEREFQYFAQELLQKSNKQFEKKDILLFEELITHKSWWDTVDFIASNVLGSYFVKFPELREKYIKKWIASNNMWLQRSALLF